MASASSPRRSQLSSCLRPPLPEKSRPEKAALASGQCVPRPRTCFPELRRRRVEQRDERQVEAARILGQRLCLEPSPRGLGIDVNALDLSFDRGTMGTLEAPYQQNSKTARSGLKAILSLPEDHLEWQQRQSQFQDVCHAEDKLWALEERYNAQMLTFASEEATRFRRARRPGEEQLETAAEASKVDHPMLAITQDYWLSASKVAADDLAKGVDYARSARGLWQVPHNRPMPQGRSVANCGGQVCRGDSGLQARARRHPDMELREVNTATPAHPCGPTRCFPLPP